MSPKGSRWHEAAIRLCPAGHKINQDRWSDQVYCPKCLRRYWQDELVESERTASEQCPNCKAPARMNNPQVYVNPQACENCGQVYNRTQPFFNDAYGLYRYPNFEKAEEAEAQQRERDFPYPIPTRTEYHIDKADYRCPHCGSDDLGFGSTHASCRGCNTAMIPLRSLRYDPVRTAAMTQTQRQQLKQQLDAKWPDTNEIVHQFPDGWTVQRPTHFSDIHKAGEQLSNCLSLTHQYENEGPFGGYDAHPGMSEWADGGDAPIPRDTYMDVMANLHQPIPYEATHRWLTDPQGVHHAAWWEQGNDVWEPLGSHNSPLKPKYLERLRQYNPNFPDTDPMWQDPNDESRHAAAPLNEQSKHYHYTSPDRVQSIMAQGISPDYDTAGEPYVFLSDQLEPRDDDAVFEVNTQGLDLHHDPTWDMYEEHERHIAPGNWYQYEGTITPDRLRLVSPGEQTNSPSLPINPPTASTPHTRVYATPDFTPRAEQAIQQYQQGLTPHPCPHCYSTMTVYKDPSVPLHTDGLMCSSCGTHWTVNHDYRPDWSRPQ